jgi:ArsR family transcriptional regulator
MRAVTLGLEARDGICALLVPGSVVDVLASVAIGGQPVSMTLLQRVEVLSAGERAGRPHVVLVVDSEQAEELAAVLKALADPVRLRLVSMLVSEPDREICACDLPEMLDRSQPTISHHLSQLVRVGLLEREQRGKWAWFRVRPERLTEISTILNPVAQPILTQ